MGFRDFFKNSKLYRAVIISRQEKQIRNFYREAYNEISEKVQELERANVPNTALQRVYLNGLQSEIMTRIDNIGNKTGILVRNGVSSQIESVLNDNKVFLNGLGFSNYQTNPRIVSAMADSILTGKLYDGKWNLSSAIWGSNQKVRSEINQIISRGILQGKSTSEIAEQLSQYVNPDYRRTVMSGTGKEIDYNAQRLARTEIQHAYQYAFVEATKDNPFIEAYRWVTSGMHNVCPVCIEREETDAYGLGAGVFPKDELPLDHPNGNCTFDIVTSWTEETARQAIFDWMFGEGDEELNRELDKFSKNF